MINIDHLERRITHRDDEPLLPPSPEEVLALIAEIRRLQSILSAYHGTTKEQLMARVDKLERENRALGKMVGERKAHRKCVECGHDGFLSAAETGLGMRYWIQCSYCGDTGLIGPTEAEAWAAWDGVGK